MTIIEVGPELAKIIWTIVILSAITTFAGAVLGIILAKD